MVAGTLTVRGFDPLDAACRTNQPCLVYFPGYGFREWDRLSIGCTTLGLRALNSSQAVAAGAEPRVVVDGDTTLKVFDVGPSPSAYVALCYCLSDDDASCMQMSEYEEAGLLTIKGAYRCLGSGASWSRPQRIAQVFSPR